MSAAKEAAEKIAKLVHDEEGVTIPTMGIEAFTEEIRAAYAPKLAEIRRLVRSMVIDSFSMDIVGKEEALTALDGLIRKE